MTEPTDYKSMTGGLLGLMQPAYQTPLSPQQEMAFQLWKQKFAPHDTGEDYDLRGAFLKGFMPDPQSGHWPDTYKKPNHPTFSNESIYATPYGAGHWLGNQYVPSFLKLLLGK